MEDILNKKGIRKPVSLAKQLSLPWTETNRAMPNMLASTALFTVGNNADPAQDRPYLMNQVVASTSDIVVLYTGQELRQDDFDVLLEIIYQGKDQELGVICEISPYALLKSIGWSVTSPTNYNKLKDCLTRLSATNVSVSAKVYGLKSNDGKQIASKVCEGMSFVRKFRYEEEDNGTPLNKWLINIEPEVAGLFPRTKTTMLAWTQSRELIKKRNPTARWLHKYISQHSENFYPHTIGKLHELSGSQAEKLYHFKETLVKALNLLVDIEFLEKWEIKDSPEKLHIVRSKRVW